jgi:peptidoglycan-associated lipoprotein
MKSYLKVLLPVAALLLAACHKNQTVADAGASTVSSGAGGGGSTSATSGSTGITGSALDSATTKALQTLVIYFDFDQAEIKPEFADVVRAHGQRLATNANLQVRLEGHTDERGSREYNIGLGDRRAKSVQRALMLNGANASQITTVSYGEERPAATGSDEESWRLNRRVEIVYR